MKLSTILSIIDPALTDVRFYESSDFYDDVSIHTTTMNVDALYKDWWDEALNCPENGAFIYSVTFCTYDGKTYMLDNSGYGEFTFEKLMEDIQTFFYNSDTHERKYQKETSI